MVQAKRKAEVQPRPIEEQRAAISPIGRTFVPGVSCDHAWKLREAWEDINPFSENHDFCAPCGSTCKRDKSGQIVEYTRGEVGA